jgi:two-component system cell cycle sensor histidine kinase/response regulator CckA
LSRSSIPGSPTRNSWLGGDANPEGRSAFSRYALAPLTVVAITVLRYALNPQLGTRSVYTFYVLSVAGSAYHGGLGPGLLALALSAAVGTYLFASPDHRLAPGSVTDWISLTIYLVTGFIIIQLIARERAARARSQLSETRYRELVETSQDLVWSVGLDGRVTFASQSGTQSILGYDASDLIGRPWVDFVPPEQRSALEATLRSVMAGQRMTHLPVTAISKTGAPRHLLMSAIPHYGPNGEVVGVTGTSTDLTERRLREDALELFRSLMEQSADGIMILDGATHTILDVNETFCRWLDFTREELKGGTTERVVHPHPRMSWEERLAEVHRIGHPTDPNAAPRMMEIAYRRRDGSVVPREVGFQYVAVQEHELIVVVARDVSERRRLELQLHHAQKMEGIGRLAGGIAHDFNNVLTAIVGYTGMARAALPASHAAVADLEEVRRAAERASALTRQLLAFARKQIIQPQLVSINQLIDGVEPMLKPLIGEDIVLNVVSASDLWLVNVDPIQVQQIVVNLAVNARDAMPSGGTLTFETANAVLGAEYARGHPDVAPGEYVRLAVTDTGIGMDEQVQQHIFEPFFTTKDRGRGTGLGLATTHGIVRQSGGHIWLYSEPGRGTTFKIYLPRATDGVAPLARVESPPAQPGWETVLVVEDEAMVRRFAVIALERLGYRALEAPDGQAALETASAFAGPIHLLFTDVVMPHMNGHELATRIRERRPDVRVLYASGYTDNTIVHQGVLEPGLAFLQKPYTAVELSAKVREVLDAPVECLT